MTAYTEDTLSPETTALLNDFTGNTRTRTLREDDDIFNTDWLDEFIEDYLGG